MDWQDYWNSAPAKCADTDFMAQVGKTVGGKAIEATHIALIVHQLREILGLTVEDAVLDLCCGNGLLTKEIAQSCRRVTGVDYSAPLIRVAREFHCPDNAAYVEAAVTTMGADSFAAGKDSGKFTKAYMYEALQYFDEAQLALILERLRPLMARPCAIFFGSVPDKERIWNYYNTPARKEDYFRRLAKGEEAIGTWWEARTLAAIAREAGFKCSVVPQPAGLYTAHYRFGLLLSDDGGQGR